jgi:hypothetical protein
MIDDRPITDVKKDRFREEELRRHYVELPGEKTHGCGHALFVKHFCTSSGCAIPCAVLADGYGRAIGARKLIAASPTKTRKIKEIVMAQVIEFYIPNNFPKPLKWAAQLQRGKVIEFRPQTRKSA